MHTWRILLAFSILLVLIAILSTIPPIKKSSMPVKKSGMPLEGREGVTTYTITYNGANSVISREVKMDVSGINIGGMNQGLITILAVIGTLVGIFSTIFWMVVVWRVLTVLEKLSTSVDRLLQQKVSDEQERDGEA